MGANLGIGLANFGNAFMQSYNNTTESDRRKKIEDEERAWKQEERDAVRAERAKQQQLSRDLSNASAPRTTMTGTVTQSDRSRVFSATPENARAMQDTLAAEADMRDEPAPTQQAGHAVTGRMSTGHKIGTGDAPAEADTPDARNERVLDAYRKNGQFDKAIQMENTVLDQKAKRIGLELDEYKALDERMNRALMENLQSAPTWWDGAAKFITNSQAGALKDVKAEPVLSKDGKTVEMFAVMPDGKRHSVWTLPANEEGMARYMELAAKVPLATRLAADKDARKQAAEQANKDREFDLDNRKADADITLKNAQAGYYKASAGAKDAGVSTSTGVSMDAIDKQLTPLFKTKDDTGVDVFDTDGMMFVRELALSTPEAASGDATGAALRAHKAYTVALSKTGGDHQKAKAAIMQAMAPRPGQAAPAGQAATPSPGDRVVAPKLQSARDGTAVEVLQGELAKAQQRLSAIDTSTEDGEKALHRAQIDAASIQAELQRMGAPVAQAPMRQATAQPMQSPAGQQAQPAKPVATMASAQQPAANPAPAALVSMQAQAAPAPSVAQILAGPGASPAIVASAQKQAQVIETVANQIKAAQAAVKQAAQSGNQAGINLAMDQVVAASAQLKAALANMNPQQAAVVVRAVGLQ